MNEATSPSPRDEDAHVDYPIPVHANTLAVPVFVESPNPVAHEKEAFQADRDDKEVAFGSGGAAAAGTICGLRRRNFYIAVVALVILVAAIVGGVVGGLEAKKSSDKNSDSPSSGSSTSSASGSSPTSSSSSLLMHPQSQIATMNQTSDWTDRDASQQSFLVYQDPTGAIMMAVYNDDTQLWSQINVTERLKDSLLPFTAKIGTPLAAVSPASFHPVLYFLQTDSRIVEVQTTDDALEEWALGDLYKADIKLDNGTRLSADWFICSPDCDGGDDGVDQIRIFFGEDGGLDGYSNVPWTKVGLEATARNGSGVGAVPYVPPSGPMQMRLFYDTGSKLGMMTWTNESGWESDNSFSGTTHATFSGQQILGTSFATEKVGDTPAWVVQALQLEKDGSLTTTYWDPSASEWKFGKAVTLKNGPSKAAFTQVAVNYDRRFYGVIDGEVYEYRISRDDPTQLVYKGQVALSGGGWGSD